MKKKIFLQFFLFFLILILSIFFLKTYFIDSGNNNLITTTSIKDIDLKKTNENLIENIEYNSMDKAGNEYIIKAKFGQLDFDQPELISMKNVSALIKSNNSEPIKIYADHAYYNNINYNTKFSKNVLVTYGDHNITSNNLSLDYEKYFIMIFDNVIYKNLNTKLYSDKVEIDLITKNSKIYMDNKTDKVKIKGLN